MKTRSGIALTVVAVLGLATVGCFNPFSPRIAPEAGIYVPPPSPTSAAGVIRLLEWCWQNRDMAKYRQIFTDDFIFQFALTDSAGNPSREPPLTREGELNMAQNLFMGGGARPPAASITLHLDPTLNATADTRPGKDPKWHREILTSVDLQIEIEDGTAYNITGFARFFVVRGDSALIPKDLNLAPPPDTTRWWIEHWNDESLTSGGSSAARPAPALDGARPATGPTALASSALRSAGFAGFTVTSVRRVRRAGALWGEPQPADITFSDLVALYR